MNPTQTRIEELYTSRLNELLQGNAPNLPDLRAQLDEHRAAFLARAGNVTSGDLDHSLSAEFQTVIGEL